jgi:hypothetical protein
MLTSGRGRYCVQYATDHAIVAYLMAKERATNITKIQKYKRQT